MPSDFATYCKTFFFSHPTLVEKKKKKRKTYSSLKWLVFSIPAYHSIPGGLNWLSDILACINVLGKSIMHSSA